MELYFPLILDGATGTELQKRGFTGDMSTEQWVLEHPEALADVQRSYAAAGSQVVMAPTFGANAIKLEEHGVFNQVADYNRRLTAISREAVPGVLVAGDMSPVGKFLLPMGDYTFEELVAVYQEQAAALEEAGVDLFAIETTMTMAEARAAVLAVKAVSRKPVFVTFTCDEQGRTLTGTDVLAALTVMQGMGVDAFGLNCSVGPAEMLAQIRRMHAIAEVPLIAKPNAGLPEMIDGRYVYNCPPEEFAAVIPVLAEAGVCIFGGCCGTDASYITAIRGALAGVQCAEPVLPADGLLPLATEKEAFRIPADTPIPEALTLTPDLADRLEEAPDDSPIVALRLAAAEDIDLLAENAWAIDKPVCFVCEDAALLEDALRVYQGRAMYDGSLPEDVLLPLSRRYGLVF